MDLAEYCGEIEFSILQFIFSTTDEIKEKITQKKLFYKEQIIRSVIPACLKRESNPS